MHHPLLFPLIIDGLIVLSMIYIFHNIYSTIKFYQNALEEFNREKDLAGKEIIFKSIKEIKRRAAIFLSVYGLVFLWMTYGIINWVK